MTIKVNQSLTKRVSGFLNISFMEVGCISGLLYWAVIVYLTKGQLRVFEYTVELK